MRTAETSQAAEITAAMLRKIPGALRQPKIAAIATNATAAMMKIEEFTLPPPLSSLGRPLES